MSGETLALAATAASLGFIHTLAGPDHYVPFIMIAKARGWSLLKTAFVTFLCGIGHILSAVLLGIIGLGFGFALSSIEAFDSVRDNIAAWLFIAFGLVYFVWGVRKAFRGRHGHGHAHEGRAGGAGITPWVLFTIFVFGPCEVLIPLLMYPAAKNSLMDAAYVTLVFGAVTITTMLGIVMVSMFGFNLLPLGKIERYTHALAGLAIVVCGVLIII
ncbi:MAG: sulfite exporter TauE/SafE family protein [Candidatus Omnitrophica bacterium]|nr:sulfite exporter TauE/SafE family protein [Candidatus Omnitrophota bacterium]